jgi:hypothetical protein
MLLYGNGRPINTNPNKDYRRLVTQLSDALNGLDYNSSMIWTKINIIWLGIVIKLI